MKLHLPHRLFRAILMAMGSTPALLSTAQAGAMQPGTLSYSDPTVTLQQHFTAGANQHYTLSPEVKTFDGGSHHFSSQGEGYHRGSLTIDGRDRSGITVQNTTLDQALVIFSDSTVQFDNVATQGDTDLIFHRADVHLSGLTNRGGHLLIDMQNGSRILGNLRLTGNTTLQFASAQETNTLSGDLTLAGGALSFGANWTSRQEAAPRDGDAKLTISGTLHITHNTLVKLTFYDLGDGASAAPSGEQAFIFCQNLTGQASQLQPYLITEDFDTGATTAEGPLKGMEFTSRPTDSGYILYLVESSTPATPEPDQPGTGGTGRPSTGESSPGIRPGQPITLAEGQSLDLTASPQTTLDASLISGRGTLITHSGQSIIVRTSRDITYTISGSSPGTPGANLIIGEQGGSITSQTSNINGPSHQQLHLNHLRINSGIVDHHTTTRAVTVEIGPGQAALNNYGSLTAQQGIIISRGGSLDNRGTIQTNADITVRSGAIFANNSTVGGTIRVEKGGLLKGTGSASAAVISGTLNVGNSPGFQQYETLTLHDSAHLIFTVDGATPATITHDGEGTHSQIRITTPGGLTADGTPTAEVIFTSNAVLGALQNGSMTLPLTLITVNDAEGNPTDATTTAGITYSVGGELANFITLSTSTGALVADLNSAAVLMGMGGSARDLANTLWSSTMVVNSFARQASAQISPARRLSTGGQESSLSVWGAGLGDFTNVGGADGFTYSGGGYAVGVDGTLHGNLRGGIAFGQQWGTFKSDARGTKVDQDSTMIGLYGGYAGSADKLDYQITAYAAYGTTDNDSRTSMGGISSGRGNWDTDTATWGLKGEMSYRYSDRASIGAFIGLDYLYGSMDSFTEHYDAGLNRRVSDGAMQVWRMPIGITWKGEYSLGGTQYLLPAISLAYAGDISRSNPHVNTETLGMQERAKGSNIGRNAFLLNAGATWLISDQWSASAAYNLEVRSGQTAQSVNAGVRYTF